MSTESKPYEPAFDIPTTAEQALAWLTKQGDPRCMTFSAKHAKAAAELLHARMQEVEVACAQAVEFATYVEQAAKGTMVERAKHFMSADFSKELAARLQASKHIFVTDPRSSGWLHYCTRCNAVQDTAAGDAPCFGAQALPTPVDVVVLPPTGFELAIQLGTDGKWYPVDAAHSKSDEPLTEKEQELLLAAEEIRLAVRFSSRPPVTAVQAEAKLHRIRAARTRMLAVLGVDRG